MKNDRIIIAISGSKGVGKDTTATMLEYIMSVGIGKANYAEWYRRTKVAEDYGENIIHFADKLKDLCAQITNLPRYYFDQHRYKDELWWIYGTEYFICDEEIEKHNTGENKKNYIKIESCNLLTLKEHLETIAKSKGTPVVKLRTILQFVGTEMFRNLYDEKYWIRNTIKRAREITNKKGFCIIPDLRFETELHSLRRACNDSEYKCIIINVGYSDTFERNANERGLHISEKQLKEFDYYISNKKEKFFVLFNEVLKFYQQSILK